MFGHFYVLVGTYGGKEWLEGMRYNYSRNTRTSEKANISWGIFSSVLCKFEH